MVKKIVLGVVLSTIILTTVFAQEFNSSTIKFFPINHASFIIKSSKHYIYVDPTKTIIDTSKFQKPDLIIITDIHRDHLNIKVVKSLMKETTKVIGPKAVITKLGFGEKINNGEEIKFDDVLIKAIPMYNTTKERLKFHKKGRGNGYVLTLDGKKVYISGDTEDIQEMRELKNIDYAFVCMNLPYTMSVEQAASAVLDFKPFVVYPYHYRGPKGYSDIEKFKKMVSKDKKIDVRLLNWYK